MRFTGISTWQRSC